MAGTYTVTQINSYIKNMFRQDFVLSKISVKGEVSNCKYHTSGHIYFTLKDEDGVMSAIMFAGNAKTLKFHLEDGQQVIVTGRVDVYERDGKYQLYANSIVLDGLGDLYIRFDELKRQYEDMGYFSPDYKQAIPRFAKKIGIVTAQTGAAIHDIMNISYRRNPYVSLLLYPALVQGDGAVQSICNGIRTLDRMGLDVLIVGRGGGSIEDLWAFNEPDVVETIFAADTPIISAVGHETDFTLADFVADLRAPTPSAAAELAVCDITLVQQNILAYKEQLHAQMQNKVDQYRSTLDTYRLHLQYRNPVHQLEEKRQYVLQAEERLQSLFQAYLLKKRHRLEVYSTKLQGLSPLSRLSGGYSYVEGESGTPVHGVKDVNVSDILQIHFKDGTAKAQVTEVLHGEDTDIGTII